MSCMKRIPWKSQTTKAHSRGNRETEIVLSNLLNPPQIQAWMASLMNSTKYLERKLHSTQPLQKTRRRDTSRLIP